MDNFKDAYYFQIPSQGNIYTVTELLLANGCRKLLVATLKRDIFCIEYSDSVINLVPTIKDISFTYIPNGAEIIAIDAFNKSSTKNEFVIGITIIKNSTELDTLETFLNIYSEWEESDEFNIENIAQNCLNVPLNYIPYKLLHTYLITWRDDVIVKKEVVFLLSGSDQQVHIYREHSTDHNYKEMDVKDHFPEFTKTPSPIMWINIFYSCDFSYRVTSFCCECGYVKLLKICTKTNKIIYNFSVRFANLVSCVYIYQENSTKPDPPEFMGLPSSQVHERPILNLVVVNSILPAVLYYDILKYGLSNYSTLPRLDSGTSVLTICEIADIDFDGKKEILIGNSAEEILFLKENEKGWFLEDMKKTSSPVISLKYLDLSSDGVKELVVFSMKGVQIFQHNSDFVHKKMKEKVERKLSALVQN